MVSKFERSGHSQNNGYAPGKPTRHSVFSDCDRNNDQGQLQGSMNVLPRGQMMVWHAGSGQPYSRFEDSVYCDRMALLVDGANLFYAASYLNIEIDYIRLLNILTQGRRLLRSYFYTGVDPQNEKQRGFLLWLSRHGYRVVSKELSLTGDGTRKANLQVEMAVDMMRLAEHCDTITLLSGDGHLAYAVDVLSKQGVSIELVGLQSMTSDALIDLADRYVDLAALQDEIRKI